MFQSIGDIINSTFERSAVPGHGGRSSSKAGPAGQRPHDKGKTDDGRWRRGQGRKVGLKNVGGRGGGMAKTGLGEKRCTTGKLVT